METPERFLVRGIFWFLVVDTYILVLRKILGFFYLAVVENCSEDFFTGFVLKFSRFFSFSA